MKRRFEWLLAPQDSLDLYTVGFVRNLSYFGKTFLRFDYSEIKVPISKAEKREKCYSLEVYTYCPCLVRCVIRSLRSFVLEPIAKPSNAAARVLCKVLGKLRTTFMKIVFSY
jgi:hypothetical protein